MQNKIIFSNFQVFVFVYYLSELFLSLKWNSSNDKLTKKL